MARSKKITQKEKVSTREVRQNENPDYYKNQCPTWAFRKADVGGNWIVDDVAVNEILSDLKQFETMTWDDILNKSNNNHHSVSIADMNKCARQRAEILKIFDEQMISLRLAGTKRIYGLLYNSALQIVWYDKYHGDNDTCVFRSNKKHT